MSAVFSADDVCFSWAAQADVGGRPIELSDTGLLNFGSGALEDEFDVHYGLLPPEEIVPIRAYSDDSNDRFLFEIELRYIVMFEPNKKFTYTKYRGEFCLFSLWPEGFFHSSDHTWWYIKVRTLIPVFECII